MVLSLALVIEPAQELIPSLAARAPKKTLPAQPGPFKTSGLAPMVRLPATCSVPPLLTVAGVVVLPKPDESQNVSMPASTVTGPLKVFAAFNCTSPSPVLVMPLPLAPLMTALMSRSGELEWPVFVMTTGS